ncbi:hypothetical protein P4C99_15465 [Pontiellaceae bacterium B1224]|nr:hypothetical protein [Pontiellaceae bacterium B1224]
MNKNINPMAMLITGTIAGFLSGLMAPAEFGLRAAAFGFCLSLTVILVHRLGWKNIITYLPAIILGIVLGFFPFELDLTYEPEPRTYDYLTVLNSSICIPLLAFAYLKNSIKKRIGFLLLFGLLSSLLRSWSFELDWRAAAFIIYNFPIGMLPFLLLWMLAMRVSDPRFNRKPTDNQEDKPS